MLVKSIGCVSDISIGYVGDGSIGCDKSMGQLDS